MPKRGFLGSRGLAEYSTSLPTKLQHSFLHPDLIQRRKGRAEWTRVRPSHKYRSQPASQPEAMLTDAHFGRVVGQPSRLMHPDWKLQLFRSMPSVTCRICSWLSSIRCVWWDEHVSGTRECPSPTQTSQASASVAENVLPHLEVCETEQRHIFASSLAPTYPSNRLPEQNPHRPQQSTAQHSPVCSSASPPVVGGEWLAARRVLFHMRY